MKLYTKKVTGCSICPNTYVGGNSEYRYGVCLSLKRRVYDIDDAKYDSEKDETDFDDKIPEDCPLPTLT
ncbi:MAG: hypothetical protein ACOCVF_00825 [bacterium]